MKKENIPASEEKLAKSLKDLEQVVREYPERYSHLFSPWKNLLFTLLKGVASGVGLFIAVALVTPLIIALLRSVDWVPLIGNFVSNIAIQLEGARQAR